MIYFVLASLVYSWIALEMIQAEPPMTFREAAAAALLCAVLAALWPPVLLWRFLLGPAGNGGRPEPLAIEDAALPPGLRRHGHSA
jgi:hypothetical protein